MREDFFFILGNVSTFIVVIPLLISVLRFRLLTTVQLKLVHLLILVLIVESISNILWRKKINNLPVYHLYTIIEFLLIIRIYWSTLSQLVSKKLLVGISVIFVVLAVLNTIFFQSIYVFNSNITTLLSILVILFSLSFFYITLKDVEYTALEKNPMFWINSGFLIYFSSNLILFFINNYLFEKSTEASFLIWGLHAIVNIVLIMFYTIAVWVNPKKQ
ncbi:hypothetical protein [Aquimarina intermedia]|uniref:Uncharacterized protein n=1 Tax=Aquimarina intermedia TaxID=350814 RepID=A0A5S5CCD8_9FLAO|nr:hypothetical protein [Aquimarina intermedia]TYP77024.1 hypothetical protein BD809_101171 [Aquimarina intermedia]